MLTYIEIILSITVGYFLGSIPFGVIVGRIFGVNVTAVGSKNIGATNVLRSVGPAAAAVVFAADMLKGAAPAWLAIYLGLSPQWIMAAGLAAVIGHTFSCFLGFKGGRGVATGLGVLLAVSPDIFLLILILAVLIMAFTRYVSLASVTCSVIASVAMFIFAKPMPYTVVTSAVAALIIIKHIPNIKRLLSGEERKLGESTQ